MNYFIYSGTKQKNTIRFIIQILWVYVQIIIQILNFFFAHYAVVIYTTWEKKKVKRKSITSNTNKLGHMNINIFLRNSIALIDNTDLEVMSMLNLEQ